LLLTGRPAGAPQQNLTLTSFVYRFATMHEDLRKRILRRIDTGFLAISVCLVVWAATQRLSGRATPEAADGFVLVLTGLAASSGASLVSRRPIRAALLAAGAICTTLGLFALLRSH
jgi:hypothetical protein